MNRIAVYDPFNEVFPDVLRSFFGPVALAREALDIRVDVTETEAEYTVHAEMPGVNKEDIQVQIDGKKVSISAEVKRVSEVKPAEVEKASAGEKSAEGARPAAARVLRNERYYGAVARSFTLAGEIDEAAASAKYENGVLTLVLPKKAAAAARRLAIH